MNTYTVEGWYRKSGERPVPLEHIHFSISDARHLQLEAAEEELMRTHAPEKLVDVDMREIDLHMPRDCGPLSDCRLRVYLGGHGQQRGQFHLIGHRAADGSLVYTNSIMVDQLG